MVRCALNCTYLEGPSQTTKNSLQIPFDVINGFFGYPKIKFCVRKTIIMVIDS